MNTIGISPRWRKVLRDIWSNKPRTILVVLAIAVGVFAFGGMFITRNVLLDNMNDGFRDSNPATLTYTLTPFDDNLVRTVRNFPYVQEVGARSSAQVQVWTGSSWLAVDLIAVPDFSQMDINRVSLEEGTLDPARREILFERQSITLLEAEVGDSIEVELPDNSLRELQVVGVVHDFNVIPASQARTLTGYVSLSTLQNLGLSTNYDELQIVTDASITDRSEFEVASDQISDLLDRYGHTVLNVLITEPGQHWASDVVDAVVLVLVVLGILALVLSGFLVVNTISAIVSQQLRQIGMMKAVGARNQDVMGIYMAMAGVFGVLALLVALPIGVLLSRGMTQMLADFINVTIISYDVPGWIFALQVVTALVAPLLAAFVPVMAGARTTVREVISDVGIQGSQRNGLIDDLLARVRGLYRPLMLSLRNTFRRKLRLTLTLITLSVAGAIFIAVLSTRASMLREFEQIPALFGMDVQVILAEPQQVSRLTREAMRIDGVTAVEGWGFAPVTSERPPEFVPVEVESFASAGAERRGFGAGIGGDSANQVAFTMMAPPPDTQFVDPTILEGRWMRPGDTNVLVIGSELQTNEPYMQVGTEIDVDFGATTHTMEIIGVVNMTGLEFGYAPYEFVSRAQGSTNLATGAMLAIDDSSPGAQDQIAREVEEQFQQIGIAIAFTQTIANLLGAITSQVDFIVGFLVFMALLLGVVGGLGLASTMSLNVLERTREIGVMRAIGASDGSVRSIFLTEGLLIGLISFVFASILSVPVTQGFVIGLGLTFFDRPMELVLAPEGFVLWFVVVLLLAAAASLLPANRAAQISVRESISYE
ncbi:MAG: FtsX-like permease family protein [Chloroflexi bacterium]|nr:FtsX-like permease family protein [Chloroflexota bacterium]